MNRRMDYLSVEQQKILVFKTDIDTLKGYLAIKGILNSYYGIIEWSLDQDDCDNVLRIVGSARLNEDSIRTYLEDAGYYCETLL